MKLMSYAFMTVASLCFMSGLFILSNEGDNTYGPTRNTSRIVG